MHNLILPMNAIDLYYAKFENQFLSEIDLSRMELHWASFQKSNLSKSKFCGAYLDWANFRDANLVDTDFSGANLNWANFQGANITGANFYGAKIQYANFDGAITNNKLIDPSKCYVGMYVKNNKSISNIDYSFKVNPEDYEVTLWWGNTGYRMDDYGNMYKVYCDQY